MEQKIIALRPHHIKKFVIYYFEESSDKEILFGQASKFYSPEFVQGVNSLFKLLNKQVIEKVKIVNGLDSLCQICEDTCKRKTKSCYGTENLQADPETLLTMAKSQLIIGKTYQIRDFIKRIENINSNYSENDLSELIKEAYANFRMRI